MKHTPARKRVQDQLLSAVLMYRVMRGLFPQRNDYSTASFDELVEELARFGIVTHGKFRALMTQHRRALLREDRIPLRACERQLFVEDAGEDFVRDAERRQYWFAYPAQIRIAAEMEFGEAAAIYESQPGDAVAGVEGRS